MEPPGLRCIAGLRVCRCWLGGLLLAGWTASAAGHAVSLGTGVLTIGPEQIELSLLLPAEDALHVGRIRFTPGDQRVAEAELVAGCDLLAKHVLARLAIRDEHGAALPLSLVETGLQPPAEAPPGAAPAPPGAAGSRRFSRREVQATRIQLRFVGRLPRRPALLTLRQTFLDDQPGHGSQLVLAVRAANEPSGTLQLTNRGNAESLLLEWEQGGDGESKPERPGTPEPPLKPGTPQVRLLEGFHRVQVRGGRDEAGLRLSIELPLTLLETWAPLPRSDRDRLSSLEQEEAVLRLTPFFQERVSVLFDGVARAPVAARVRLFCPSSGSAADDDPARGASLSTWAARVEATLSYPLPAAGQAIVLDWGLFNAAAPTVDVALGGTQPARPETLSPHTPRTGWAWSD